MERNTKTQVKNLVIGDRFYKASDGKRTVLQIVPGEVKVTKYTTYDVWCKADADLHKQAMKSNTQVVFLRHAQPATA